MHSQSKKIDWEFFFEKETIVKKFFIAFSVLLIIGGFNAAAFGAEAEMEKEVVPPSVDLDNIVVTATRIGQPRYKVPGNVTVLTRQQIEESNAQTIPDMLKEALGVHVSDNSTVKSAKIDIRGFGDTTAQNVLVLVNDRKINPVDISGPDLTQIPLEAVERIEIIRGAGSVLYGDNAVGGVVNIITKKGKGSFQGRVGGSYGSYDAQKSDVEVSGYKHNVSYYLYSQYNDKRGYRENSDLLAQNFNTRLGYDLTEKISADLNVGWHHDVQELPGGISESQMRSLGRRESVNRDDTSYTTDRYIQLAFDVTPWPEDFYFGNFVLDLYYRNRDAYDEFNSFGPFHTKRNIDTSGITGKYIFDRTIFGQEVNFVTGIDAYDTENDILGSRDNVDDITISKREFGLFGYLQYEAVDNVFVNAGSRYHKAYYVFDQRNVSVYQKENPDVWVSMGGLKYEYAQGSNLHLNVQQTFRFLATDEWYSTANFPGFGITPGLNLNLDQQHGVQYEAGIKHNFNDYATVSVTPYYMVLKNEIFFDPVTFANSNYERTHRVGVEVGNTLNLLKVLSISQLDELEIFSNYTYQDAQFGEGASDGKDIPMVPRYQVSGGLRTGFLQSYQLSLIGHYVGSRFAVNDVLNAATIVKEYFVLDSRVAFKKKYFEIYGEVNNILNEFYSGYVSKSTFSTTKSYFPSPARNFTVGMNVKF